MTAKEFVKAATEEKENIMSLYFSDNAETEVGKMIKELVKRGASKETLYQLVDMVLNETYYNLMLALDGESALGHIQMPYKLFDQNGNELTGSGEIECEAFEQFMEKI